MRRYPEFGFLSSADLNLLSRVLKITTPEGVSEDERQARAATLVRLFQEGITTEEALVREVGGPAQ